MNTQNMIPLDLQRDNPRPGYNSLAPKSQPPVKLEIVSRETRIENWIEKVLQKLGVK